MEPEPPDLRPLQKAIQTLRYTQALDASDERYVERSDDLGKKLVQRLLAPTEPLLLLAGTPGCGKSTELARLPRQVQGQLRAVYCGMDGRQFLPAVDNEWMIQALLIAIYWASRQLPTMDLSKEIRSEVRQALHLLGDDTFRSLSVRLGIPLENEPPARGAGVARDATFVLTRLIEELNHAGPPLVLLIDGLEKLLADKLPVLEDLVRGPILADVRSVIVVPHWRLYGWDSLRQIEGVEVLEVPQPLDNDFVRRLLARRLDGLIDDPALTALANLSGGVARDGLQLATRACRHAIDVGSPRVTIEHVFASQQDFSAAYEGIFSDDPVNARAFLANVRQKKALEGPPALRDRMLASGAVLLGSDRQFFVHPALARL